MNDSRQSGFFSRIGAFLRSLFCVHDGKEPRLLTFSKKSAARSVLSSLLCILSGIFVGFLFMLIMAAASDDIEFYDALRGLVIMITGPFSSGIAKNVIFNFGNMVFYASPLIMTGLSVAIAFKTGLFNIGAAGQFFMGTLGALLVALNIDCTGKPSLGVLVWLLALLTGMLCGMLWGCIPGLFKAFFNINEVIVCIMTNWIAANIVSWVFGSQGLKHLVNTAGGKSGYLITTAKTGTGTPKLLLDRLFPSSYIDISILIAVLFAVAIFVVLNKTTFGFELKACGNNKNAAKYAGMNEKRNIVLSMAIAGGLAAAGGAFYYLNPGIELNFISSYQILPDYGFNGIPAALLASSDPIGVVFSGLLLRFLNQGGDNLQLAGYSRYVSDIVVALIIYFAGFSKFIRDLIVRAQKKRTESVMAKAAKKQDAASDRKEDR